MLPSLSETRFSETVEQEQIQVSITGKQVERIQLTRTFRDYNQYLNTGNSVAR